MVEMTLELVPASKRLLDSDIPQGNTRLPRSWVVLGKYSPRSTHTWLVWAYLSCNQLNEPTIRFRLENVLVMCLGQGPMPSGLEALCCTTSFRDLYLWFNFIKPISTNQVYMIPSILLAQIFLPIVFFT